MTDKVEVLDKLMGSFKTSSILNWCEANPTTPVLYVTPLLSESEDRVVNACIDAKFTAPNTENFKTKGEHLLDLLQSGVNISITHALYSSLKDTHLAFIKLNKYTLILDEEVSFIEPLAAGYNKEDFSYLRGLNQFEVDEEDGKVIWLNTDICDGAKYSKLANMCRLGMVYQAKRSEDIFVTQLPMGLIESANRVILLTYLFEGSILSSFLKMKGITVTTFTDIELNEKPKSSLIPLIEFVGENQVREWAGESLSSSWYAKATQKDLTKMAKSIRAIGVFCKASNSELVWSAPSSLATPTKKGGRKISPKGYTAGTGLINDDGYAEGCFLACSSRATNAYRNRSVMVHAYNRFPHLSVSSFLQDYGVPVDANQFALSELLQWIWRSRVRQGEPIKLCIISKRMRKLFQEWLYKED